MEQEVVAGGLYGLEADFVVLVRETAQQHLLDHLPILGLCTEAGQPNNVLAS